MNIQNHKVTSHPAYLKTLEELSAYRKVIKKTDSKSYRQFKKLKVNKIIDILESSIKLNSEILQNQSTNIEHE